MTCEQIRRNLSAYVDGELGGSTAMAVRSHCSQCEACALLAREEALLKRWAACPPSVEPSEGFEERLVASVFERRSVHGRVKSALSWASGLAVAAAVVGAFFWMRSERIERDQLATAPPSNFELARDQAYAAGMDPLSGGSSVLPASYDAR